jgi:hypothetical protein
MTLGFEKGLKFAYGTGSGKGLEFVSHHEVLERRSPEIS